MPPQPKNLRRHHRTGLAIRRVLLTALLVAAGSICAGAGAITNANPSTAMPWAVRLTFIKIKSGKTAYCTGNVLSQHWIITAAHCLRGRSNESDRVAVDHGAGQLPLYGRARASFYNHPDYNHIADWGADLGLVRLYGDGIFPELHARVWDGTNEYWKAGGAVSFFAAGYGWGTDPVKGEKCNDPDATIGVKRLGRFQLTGKTRDSGLFGQGDPIAVKVKSAEQTGKHDLCQGDSGGPWAFAVGGRPTGEMFVFALYAGEYTPWTGSWGPLLPPRMKWVTEATKTSLPLACPSYLDWGSYYRHRRCTEGYWVFSSAARRPLTRLRTSSTPLLDVAFADLDGDRRDDAFRIANHTWYVSDRARSDWESRGGGTGSVALGDFDGDRFTDILQQPPGATLYVLYNGRYGYLPVLNYGIAPSGLTVGDFDGDGVDDIFRSGGGTWYVSYATRDRSPWSPWTPVASSALRASALRFGDFNGDGADDAFHSSGGAWYVSYANKKRGHWKSWTKVASSAFPTSSLAVGDFNGDGTDDVFRTSGHSWYVSDGARTRWKKRLGTSSLVPLTSLRFGDFDGDRRTDVIYLKPAG
jgi:hypothetical protein